jgi:hypothetical protein
MSQAWQDETPMPQVQTNPSLDQLQYLQFRSIPIICREERRVEAVVA